MKILLVRTDVASAFTCQRCTGFGLELSSQYSAYSFEPKKKTSTDFRKPVECICDVSSSCTCKNDVKAVTWDSQNRQ